MPDKPIINCHMHIFTSKHVPPFIAKTFVLWPLYYLLHLGRIVALFRFYFEYIDSVRFKFLYKLGVKVKTAIAWFFNAIKPVKIPLSYYLTIQAFFILYDLISPVEPKLPDAMVVKIEAVRTWLAGYYLLLPKGSTGRQILLVLVVLLLIPSGRNLLYFVFSRMWKFLAVLPGPATREMFRRYLNLGRFAFHDRQRTVLSKIQGQYPDDTAFVILPMDMEFMAAGPVKTSYRCQMAELAELKANKDLSNIIYPFVFADPRRMEKEDDYFAYEIADGKVVLKPCFIKTYIEEKKFSGIKIYPALGYYPFDERLLPLWKYTADNGLPITTHCIRGTIFYRGWKKLAWNEHPFIGQSMQKGKHAALTLPEMKNVDFSVNFTHPMNYLYLLKEERLRMVVAAAKDDRIRELFGFTDLHTPLQRDLHHLKICFGHYGGDDEWNNFFEKDRFDHSAQVIKRPELGIRFSVTTEEKPFEGQSEQLWKYTDWYSIISSMMIQHPNVYADISYILHNNAAILPLLKETLRNGSLRKKVLYGTDFYVVRNHKSDKNMVADMQGGLDAADFHAIARDNPRDFLNNRLHGQIPI